MSLSSFPCNTRNSLLAFGLTVNHNSPLGGSTVPLVSTATNQPPAWNSASSGSSSCNKGSPPVHTTNGLTCELGQWLATALTSSAGVRNLPPPVPSVPTKSVSHQREQPPG